MTWDAVTAIATAVSMVAFVLTAMYVRGQLRAIEKDRYLTITNELFTTWLSREFMEAQLWLLHRLAEGTWPEFVAAHRGDAGEVAFHRVGSYYNRIGTLVRMGLIDDAEILSTVGGYAIAIWNKIEPMVREARRIENSTLFDDFERLLPACHECYVPSLGAGARVRPFALDQPADLVTPRDLKRRLDAKSPPTLLDVRQPSQVAADPRRLPDARLIPPDDIEARVGELPAGRDVAVYCA